MSSIISPFSGLSDFLVYTQGPKKTLVMREIPEDGVEKFLRNKEALAACDIAVFVHDR